MVVMKYSSALFRVQYLPPEHMAPSGGLPRHSLATLPRVAKNRGSPPPRDDAHPSEHDALVTGANGGIRKAYATAVRLATSSEIACKTWKVWSKL